MKLLRIVQNKLIVYLYKFNSKFDDYWDRIFIRDNLRNILID